MCAISPPSLQRQASLCSVEPTLPPGPILKSLNDKLTKKKLLPLSSKVTLTITMPRAASSESIVTTTEVQSITEESLDDALFKVPSDYTKVDPAAANPSNRSARSH